MQTILFVCIQNAGRSQMAEAFFNQISGGKATAISAGSLPAAHVHPTVVEAMNEVGIDLSGKIPQKLSLELLSEADVVVTLGCGGGCPMTSLRTIEWQIEDPSGKPMADVRRIQDEIRDSIAGLITELGI